MSKKEIIDLSPKIFTIVSYISIILIILNIGMGLFFDGKVNKNGVIPNVLLLLFCIYNIHKLK